MMWLLVMVFCVTAAAAPNCESTVNSVHFRSLQACEDAAVRSHDQIRARAGDARLAVLLLDTRCIAVPVGGPE